MRRLMIYGGIALSTFFIGFAVETIWREFNNILNWCGEILIRGMD